jgi:rhodanese-related sulfurtransferase
MSHYYSPMRHLTPAQLRELMASGTPHAVVDVREGGEYNTAHIPRSTSLPRRWLEWRARRLLPFAGVSVAVVDDDGRRAARAAATLEAMGYTDVAVLAGGLFRWVTDGLPTEWGVNVPSKDFGERVLTEQAVAEIGPDELRAWMDEGREFLLLDSRTPEEHASATLPGSRSLPGGELALRFGAIAPPPGVPVVVHCAGRTRSIMGARTLARLGVENVLALRNGTMGWAMAGNALEHGSRRTAPPVVDAAERAAADARVRALAEADGVRPIDAAGLRALQAQAAGRTVYFVDVRSREEFGAGHIPGFTWFPGGQAVQTTDELVAVWDATVVLTCDGWARAGMTASWLRQLGLPDVRVLDGGTPAWVAAGGALEAGEGQGEPFGLAEARTAVPTLDAPTLGAIVTHGADIPDAPVVLDVGTSREFSAGHVPGAHWVPRGWLEEQAPTLLEDAGVGVVTVCADGTQALLAARTLQRLGHVSVSALEGGMRAWRAAGQPQEQGLTGVRTPPQDMVLSGTERSGADMMRYLQWEVELGERRGHGPTAS